MKRYTFIRLTPVEAATMLLHEPELRILDARDEAAFKIEHIEGATRLHSANLDAAILGTSRQRPVLIYCYHGNASQQYARMFADVGFPMVFDLIGGFDAWRSHRTAAPPQAPTLAAWLKQQGFPGVDVGATIANATTPLMQAARLGEVAIAEELIACGAALSPTNSDGNNALWLACFSGNVKLVDLLIAKGIAIDNQNDNGATCLMYAASAGKTEVLERLLSGGADASLKSLDDFTALDMAANIECLRLLRKTGPRQLQPEHA